MSQLPVEELIADPFDLCCFYTHAEEVMTIEDCADGVEVDFLAGIVFIGSVGDILSNDLFKDAVDAYP